MTLDEKAREKAKQWLGAALAKASEQLTQQWQRRDVSDEDAIEIRHEMMALQRVELNLTRLLAEAQNATEL